MHFNITKLMIFCLLFVGGNACNGQDEIFFQQVLEPFDVEVVFTSDFNGNFRSADNFEITSTVKIASIDWWGGHLAPNVADVDNFTIRIHNDLDSVPDGLAAFLDVSGVQPTRVDTGVTVGTITQFMYSYDVGSLELEPGIYWLEIANNTFGNPTDATPWVHIPGSDDANGGTVLGHAFYSVFEFDWTPILGEGAFRLNSIAPDFLLGDVNCDGVVNLLDVAPFVEALTSGEFNEKADVNEDGVVNLLDVQPFVSLLAG